MGVTDWWWVTVAINAILSSLIAFMFLAFTLPAQYSPYAADFLEPNASKTDKNATKISTSVQIVVLGDIGRSPRMQYHALSFAKHQARVDLVGYTESEMHPDLQHNRYVNIIPLPAVPRILRTDGVVLLLLLGPFKMLWQTWTLYRALGTARPSKWMLIQNPPAIPTILLAVILCWWRNTRLVIDWHNLGYSVLAQKLGAYHILVWFSSWYETYAASAAYAHFAVSDAMTKLLKELTGLKISTLKKRDPFIMAKTLRDRPASIYQPLTEAQRSEFLRKCPETAQYAKDIEKKSWRLLVCPTSWSADEDFALLLASLAGYSTRAAADKTLPKILVIITGKGPLKDFYLQKIKQMNQEKKLTQVIIQTTWLSAEDYASLLGSADLGISLHRSTSGVDLPMKVVDMFGAGLPVLGWSDFEAWPELVKEDVNGKGFTTAQQLLDLLDHLLGADAAEWASLKNGAIDEGKRRWDDEWDDVAGKLFRVVKSSTAVQST